MRFEPLPLPDAFVIVCESHADERGTFARTWCQAEAAAHGIDVVWVQANVSTNRRLGTLRGMHFQTPPYQEAKLVRCTRGSIYDVIIDLRPKSPTFCQWAAVELTAANDRQLFIPAGFAHGFQTLSDEAEVTYLMSAPYRAEASRGVRWNDPAFGIEWPATPLRTLSSRDANFPDFQPCSAC